MPDITIPEAAVPHAAVPHVAVPHVAVPHAAVQHATVPGVVAAPAPRFSRPLAVAAAAVVLLLAGTVMLWAHYGTAVFYETILAGIAACF